VGDALSAPVITTLVRQAQLGASYSITLKFTIIGEEDILRMDINLQHTLKMNGLIIKKWLN